MAKTERDKASEDMMHFIRVMRCLETTGLAFVGICFTCDRRFHIGYLDAGHFISGRRNAVLFDIMCIRLQCNYCNVTMHSQPKIYKAKMIKLYGEQWVEERKRRAKRVIKDNQIDYKKLRAGIKRMTEKIYRKHGYKTFGEILQEGK